ncbi:MAG: acetoacetate decarboxylase family protein [Thermoanaerobacteraceae bacterium]|nr:acetoacetate decarboxylase family protein [Thermoanaerobacteraceae bacterium]
MGKFMQETSIPNDGTLMPFALDRDPKGIITQAIADPVFDIDGVPVYYTNSRWCAFILRADEKELKRILPEPLQLEDDIVEFWYVDHDNTSLGPYYEMGVTISASYQGYKGGYYPYMYLTSDAGVWAGRDPFGFPKKIGHISVLEHGGKFDNGYEKPGSDFFSFFLERWGYMIHTATGRYTGNKMSDLKALPKFYGKTDWGRFNYRVHSSPDLTRTDYALTYLDSLYDGEHRFQLKMDSIRTAQAGDIRTWYMGTSPFDNMAAYIRVVELIGLVSFNFDLIIPAAKTLWTKTVTRTADEVLKQAVMMEPKYKYSMRMRFPMPVGV